MDAEDLISQSLVTSVLSISCWVMIGTGVVTLLSTMLIAAPYGKFSSSKGWGPLIPAQLAWMFMEAPNLWMTGLILFLFAIVGVMNDVSPTDLPVYHTPNQLLLSLFLIHYFNRSIVFPMSMPEGNPMPLTVMLLAFSYCLWNGFTQALSLVVITHYPSGYHLSFQFMAGVALFLTGLYINISSDRSLFALKTKAKTQGVQYVIPEGGWFQYVSCANYCKCFYFF
jgi:hypothetical protein